MIDLLEQRVVSVGRKAGWELSLDLSICPKCRKRCYVIRLNGQHHGGLYLPHGEESGIELQSLVFELSENVINAALNSDAFNPHCYARLLVGFTKVKARKPSFLIRVNRLSYVISDPLVLKFGAPPSYIQQN